MIQIYYSVISNQFIIVQRSVDFSFFAVNDLLLVSWSSVKILNTESALDSPSIQGGFATNNSCNKKKCRPPKTSTFFN